MQKNMLKLSKPYNYTKDEWQHVNTVLRPYAQANSGKKAWEKSDNQTNAIKNNISTHTLIQQNCRCAYCESIITGGAQLDHFLPKQEYKEYCYEPKNLLTGCTVCNMYLKKAGDPLVPPKVARYEQNKFRIVHPYFNDPSFHIKYINDDRIHIDINNCTTLGKETVDIFNMDTLQAEAQRSINLTVERALKNGDITIDILKLARVVSTYKK